MNGHGGSWTRLAMVGALVALAAPSSLEAQGRPDFLLGTPNFSLGVRTGYSVANAGSDIFDFTAEQLTVESSDFNAPVFGVDLAVHATDRIDVALNVAWAESEVRSEFRDWVDTNDLPIEQDTRLSRGSVTLGAKVYLQDRGRSVGRFVWIPRSWSPYVGAAGGVAWYTFEQRGDFVDFETLDIFFSEFDSEGNGATGHLFGGIDVTLTPRLVLNAEGRYQWASVEMDREFVDFDDIDLSGFQLTAGVSVRF